MAKITLSFNTRKSLCNHLGEAAGNELAEFLQHIADRLENVERNKVDVIPVIPKRASSPMPAIENELQV